MEITAQQVDSVIAGWMECVTVNFMWKVLHSNWTVLLQLECTVFQWTLSGRYFTVGRMYCCSLNGVYYSEFYVVVTAQQVDSCIAIWMDCVTLNVMRKLFHSTWTEVLQFEWCVLQWNICGSYCTACGQSYFSLNGMCYSQPLVEFTALHMLSVILGWMECVTVCIMWNLLHSMLTVVLQLEWSVLYWT